MSTNHTSDLPQGDGQAPAIDGLVEHGSPTDAAVQVAQAGSTTAGAAPEQVIEVSPGEQIDLSAYSLEGSTMTLDGQNLILTLADGTKIVLQDFVTAVASDNPPSFQFSGGLQMTADDMLANSTLAPGTQQTASTPDQVVPAAGGPQNDGTIVVPEPQGPIGPGATPTGPLGPTSLAFTAPVPELNVVLLPTTPAGVETPVTPPGVCEAISCQELFSSYMATWNGPVDGKITADNFPSGPYLPGQGDDFYQGTKVTDLMLGNSDEDLQVILGHGGDDWIMASGDTLFNAVHGDTPFVYESGNVPDVPLVASQVTPDVPSVEGGGTPGNDVIFGGDYANQIEILAGGGGNDYIDGQAGHELIVGDEVALTYVEESHYTGDQGDPHTETNFIQIGNGNLAVSDTSEGPTDDYNDVLFSGDGHAIMVGDVAATGAYQETNYNWEVVNHVDGHYGDGEYGEGYTDDQGRYHQGEYTPGPYIPGHDVYDYVQGSSSFSIGFAEGISLEATAQDGGSVNAFNDFIDAETQAGSGGEESLFLASYKGGLDAFGSALIGDVAALGTVGDYYEENIFLNAALDGRGSKFDSDGGSVTAFNDDLCGTELSDLLVGDVLQVGFGEGQEYIVLSAEGYATSGGSIDAYNDTLLGQGGDDFLVGDVKAWGLGNFSNVILGVTNRVDGYGDPTEEANGNTFTAFNDRIRPGTGNDTSIGDIYVNGDYQNIHLTASNAAYGAPYSSMYGEGGVTADNNTFNAYNDEICDDGGSALAIGDVYTQGTDNYVTLSAENGADGAYGEGDSASNNTFTVFSDVLHGHEDTATVGEGSEVGNSTLIGDVLMTSDDGHNSEIGNSAYLDVRNEAYSFTHPVYGSSSVNPAGGVADNNTFNAFNDTLLGAGGNDTLVGDLAMVGSLGEGGLSVGNAAYGSSSLYASADGGEANGNTFNSFNDDITGAAGEDYAVGDVWFDGRIDGGTDNWWEYSSSVGGLHMLAGNYAGGAYGSGMYDSDNGPTPVGGEADDNVFNVFNDAIDIGDGGGGAVGDLYFTGYGEGHVSLAVANAAEGSYGNDADGGDASNNTFNAFNDTITGGYAEYVEPRVVSVAPSTQVQAATWQAAALMPFAFDSNETLVGDVLFEGSDKSSVPAPDLNLQVYNEALSGYHGPYGEGGTADNNTFNTFNDTMIGGPEDGPVFTDGDYQYTPSPNYWSHMVGDVMAVDAGNVTLGVFNGANDFGSNYSLPSSASDNTFNAFNDDMTLGFGEGGIMVGDVYASGSCGGDGSPLDISLVASNYAYYEGAATGNTFNVFNDTITGHDYGDEIVGDVYVFGGSLDHLEMGLYNDTSTDGGNTSYSDASGTTFNAFNDTIDAGGSGSGYYYSGNYVDGDVYFEGTKGCDVSIDLAALGTYGVAGNEDPNAFSDHFTAWSDTIVGGGGYDWIVGDMDVGSYNGAVHTHIVAGSEYTYGYADGTYSLFNDTMDGGGGHNQMFGDMNLWGGGEFNVDVNGAGTFDMFNDSMTAGGGVEDGNNYMVGDIEFNTFDFYDDSTLHTFGSYNVNSDPAAMFTMYNDTMTGGGSNDTMIGDLGFYTAVDEDGGFQIESIGYGSFSQFNDTMNGGGGNDYMVGDALFHDSHFTFSVDVENYGEGTGSHTMFSDTMNGGTGNDVMFGDFFWGSDTDLANFDPSGESGSYTFDDLLGDQGSVPLDFNISGNFAEGDPTLFSDTLNGGEGDDNLIGQFGADILTGGAGADTFWFAEGDGSQPSDAANGGQNISGDISDLDPVIGDHVLTDQGAINPGDVITDFQVGTDHIGLYGTLTYDTGSSTDVQISDDGQGNALISVSGTNEILATVLNVSATQLDDLSNFVTA